MTTDITLSEPIGTKPTKVYIISRTDLSGTERIYKSYVDRNHAHKIFDEFCDLDIEEEYTWCITSQELSYETV